MKVVFAGQTLADWDTPVSGLSVDGQALIQQTAVVRAVAQILRYRGNETVSVTFTTVQEFSDIPTAEVFALTNFSSLVKQGVATFYAGTGSGDAVTTSAANAVLKDARYRQIGASIWVTYHLIVGTIATASPPDVIPPSTGQMTEVFAVALNPGDTTWAVTFGTAFTSTPFIPLPSVNAGVGGAQIFATITGITLTGCSGVLTAPIPDTGYVLSGLAVGV